VTRSSSSTPVSEQPSISAHSSEGAVSLAQNLSIVQRFVFTKKEDIKWSNEPFNSCTNFPKEAQSHAPAVDTSTNDVEMELEPELCVGTPISYFRKYIPHTLFESAAHFTNLYAMQEYFKPAKVKKNPDGNQEPPKQKKMPVSVSAQEIGVCFALHMLMGVLRLPRVRMYWGHNLNIRIFIDNMTRD